MLEGPKHMQPLAVQLLSDVSNDYTTMRVRRAAQNSISMFVQHSYLLLLSFAVAGRHAACDVLRHLGIADHAAHLQ
jgi:hypothetical protein